MTGACTRLRSTRSIALSIYASALQTGNSTSLTSATSRCAKVAVLMPKRGAGRSGVYQLLPITENKGYQYTMLNTLTSDKLFVHDDPIIAEKVQYYAEWLAN